MFEVPLGHPKGNVRQVVGDIRSLPRIESHQEKGGGLSYRNRKNIIQQRKRNGLRGRRKIRAESYKANHTTVSRKNGQ